MAEAILNKVGHPRFKAYSAGSRPAEKVPPLTIELLGSLHYPTATLHSKSWLEFTYMTSPDFDLVIIVFDNTSSELCPTWPGDPVIAHWSLPDPVLVSGSPVDQLKVFSKVYQELERRIRHLVQLPSGPLNRETLIQHLTETENVF
jgi:arsenate reductase